MSFHKTLSRAQPTKELEKKRYRIFRLPAIHIRMSTDFSAMMEEKHYTFAGFTTDE